MNRTLAFAIRINCDIKEFKTGLIKVGSRMTNAMSNPVEGTFLSVVRDSTKELGECEGLVTVKDLMSKWVEIANIHLKATPEKLIVDGKKVLAGKGVVDSGAQGFVYILEGMLRALKDEKYDYGAYMGGESRVRIHNANYV